MKLLLILSPEEKPYLHRFSELLDGHKASVYWGEVSALSQLDIFAKRMGAQAIITNRKGILELDTPGAKVDNFRGSIIHTPRGLEILCLPPLRMLVVQSYGEFLFKRFLSKILAPDTWPKASPFHYKVLREDWEYQEFKTKFSQDQSWLCAIDTETTPPNRIRSVSYTLKHHDNSTSTGCFLINSMDAVRWMRELNATDIPKVCQNGKYDCAHFFAWSAPMVAYYGDTLNAMHATWSELPKDLNIVSALFNRNHRYWKDMREAETPEKLLEYNALDTWGTCEAFCSWLAEAPEYARKNYAMKFPQVYLSHEMEMRGLKRDIARKRRWNSVYSKKLERVRKSLEVMTGTQHFNPSSPVQVKSLLKILTRKDWDSSDEAAIEKVRDLHPLNARVLGQILEFRSDRKMLSTYLGIGSEDKDFHGRWLYSINPTGTETGRDASAAHHFWCGQNIQNVPNEVWQIKNTVIADTGFEFWEADFRQAEARGVAYSSGDTALLKAVESPKDFHSLNASAFFGIPYEEIYSDGHDEYWDSDSGRLVAAAAGKVLNKPIRNLAKRVNHGANYNMTAPMLLRVMGDKHVREAQILLGLDRKWTLHKVCEYLLLRYEQTYPRIKTAHYKSIISQVRKHSYLVGPTGWTRWCFGKPWANKPALNEYVAHVTQSLNAMNLDEAALRVFNWRLDNNLLNIVKINAKIHDSLLFQVPIGRSDLAEEVAQRMRFPVQVTDCFGISREMIVPVDLKYCGRRWEKFQ